MASWVEELFPPKLKINDLTFDKDGLENKPAHLRSNGRSRQIYEDVFEEMLSNVKREKVLERGQHEVPHSTQLDEPGSQRATEEKVKLINTFDIFGIYAFFCK